MKRSPLILSMAIVFAISGFNIANAAQTSTQQPPQKPPFEEFQEPPSNEGFNGPPPMEHFAKQPKFDKQFPSKAEMEAKKAEFEKRLKLTDKQKKQIDAQKKTDIEKIKPIIDEMHKKRHEFKTVTEDKTLSKEAKDKKLNEIRENLKTLGTQADYLRKENMANFENILTEKQKKEFSKIKEEQKKEMEQRKKDFGRPPFPQNK